MDIVKSNFEQQSNEFFQNIEKTEFIAFDLEFTGIKTDEKTSRTDTCAQRYNKCYQVAKRYQIIQFGISQYIKTGDNSYDCSTYNFYVFPSSFKEKFNNYFKCDVSTIEFLVSCNSIDFNKWMYEGVPYFNKDQIETIKKSLSQNTIQDIIDNGVKRPTEFYTLEEKDMALQDWAKVKEWMLDENSQDSMIYERDLFPFKKFLLENFLKEFSENKQNYYFQEQYYPDQKKRYLKIFKVNEQQLQQKNDEKKALLEEELNHAKGFAKFWDKFTEKIQEYNIPVVGHNMYLDLLFVCNHFENFITDDYMLYKQSLKNMFPIIYDTKILQQASKVTSNFGLEQIYKHYQQKYKIEINDKNNSLQDGVAHNAGYDAYMTGACFLHFQKDLDIKKYENLIKLYGHPYIAMKNDAVEDHQTLEKIYVLGYKLKKIEKNQKATINKIFKDAYKGDKLQLQISEKRLNSKNESSYMLYFEGYEKCDEKERKNVDKILSAISKKFTDIMEYKVYDQIVLDELKSRVKKDQIDQCQGKYSIFDKSQKDLDQSQQLKFCQQNNLK